MPATQTACNAEMVAEPALEGQHAVIVRFNANMTTCRCMWDVIVTMRRGGAPAGDGGVDGGGEEDDGSGDGGGEESASTSASVPAICFIPHCREQHEYTLEYRRWFSAIVGCLIEPIVEAYAAASTPAKPVIRWIGFSASAGLRADGGGAALCGERASATRKVDKDGGVCWHEFKRYSVVHARVPHLCRLFSFGESETLVPFEPKATNLASTFARVHLMLLVAERGGVADADALVAEAKSCALGDIVAALVVRRRSFSEASWARSRTRPTRS